MPDPTPLQVVVAAFAAAKRQDWDSVAQVTDPSVVAEYQREQIALLVARHVPGQLKARAGSRTLEAITDEGGLAENASFNAVKDVQVPIFEESLTIGHLAALSPQEFFLRWCDASHRAHNALSDDPPEWEGTLLGEVYEGKEWAHVLYREPPQTKKRSPWHVFSLRRVDGRWLLTNPPILEWRWMVGTLLSLY